MTEDMKLRHDDPREWEARRGVDAGGRFVGWTLGEVLSLVVGGLLIGIVVGAWVLEGLGVGIWEVWR